MMTVYEYQKVRFNGCDGWIAIRYIDGVQSGKSFGTTKQRAREAFDCYDDYNESDVLTGS